jgi:Raf kinase inhibitor-like YbhB/YbcL family protein
LIKTLAMLAYLFTGTHHHQLPMTLTSPISPKIPVEHTCHGHNILFPMRWHHVPAGTRSLALVMMDEDEPENRRYLWAVYNILPERHWIGPAEQLLRGERYAQNSWGHLAYDGPCPLQGKHHYVARLYALKVRFYFEKKMAVSRLLKAMKHRIIATATLKMHYKAPTLSPRA